MFSGTIHLDASDVNDDGVVDIGDALYLLDYLTTSGPDPLPPFPTSGSDPTLDFLNPICEGATSPLQSAVDAFLASSGAMESVVGDFDADGYPDLVVRYDDVTPVEVLSYDSGSGSFVNEQNLIAAIGLTWWTSIDLAAGQETTRVCLITTTPELHLYNEMDLFVGGAAPETTPLPATPVSWVAGDGACLLLYDVPLQVQVVFESQSLLSLTTVALSEFPERVSSAGNQQFTLQVLAAPPNGRHISIGPGGSSLGAEIVAAGPDCDCCPWPASSIITEQEGPREMPFGETFLFTPLEWDWASDVCLPDVCPCENRKVGYLQQVLHGEFETSVLVPPCSRVRSVPVAGPVVWDSPVGSPSPWYKPPQSLCSQCSLSLEGNSDVYMYDTPQTTGVAEVTHASMKAHFQGFLVGKWDDGYCELNRATIIADVEWRKLANGNWVRQNNNQIHQPVDKPCRALTVEPFVTVLEVWQLYADPGCAVPGD